MESPSDCNILNSDLSKSALEDDGRVPGYTVSPEECDMTWVATTETVTARITRLIRTGDPVPGAGRVARGPATPLTPVL